MITREDLIEQTLTDFLQSKLTANGYIPDVVDIREAFPSVTERSQEMTKTQVSIGFNFDDGGRPAELGSDLCIYTHTVEFWTFGLNEGEGRNVANFIKQAFRANMNIGLKDYGDEDEPVIANMEIPDARSISTTRQISRNPFPWDQFVWSTVIRIQDYYAAEMV